MCCWISPLKEQHQRCAILTLYGLRWSCVVGWQLLWVFFLCVVMTDRWLCWLSTARRTQQRSFLSSDFMSANAVSLQWLQAAVESQLESGRGAADQGFVSRLWKVSLKQAGMQQTKVSFPDKTCIQWEITVGCAVGLVWPSDCTSEGILCKLGTPVTALLVLLVKWQHWIWSRWGWR